MVAEHRRLTVDEFLAWSEQNPELRTELIDGEIVAMAPESWRHGLVKGNAWLALRNAIAAAGRPCRALVDSVGVRIADSGVFIPDATVECETFAVGNERLVRPVVVVEVLSPSTRRYDLTRKLAGYTAQQSIAHYLIVDPENRTVEHYRRTDAGFVVELPTDILALEPPGLTLAIADLFDGA